MPQMAPLLWSNLFIFFTGTFLVFFILNYFLKSPTKVEAPSTSPDLDKLNWKW